MSDTPCATITLYIDPAQFEQDAGEPLTKELLEDIGNEVNENASFILGYGAWETKMPPEPKFKGLPKPGSVKQEVLLYIAKNGPCIRGQVNAALGYDEQGPTNRMNDLVNEGLLCDTGEFGESSAGCKARTIRLTERGRLELKLIPTRWYPNGERVL